MRDFLSSVMAASERRACGSVDAAMARCRPVWPCGGIRWTASSLRTSTVPTRNHGCCRVRTFSGLHWAQSSMVSCRDRRIGTGGARRPSNGYYLFQLGPIPYVSCPHSHTILGGHYIFSFFVLLVHTSIYDQRSITELPQLRSDVFVVPQ